MTAVAIEMARATRSDGRLEPMVGDQVSTGAPGFGGGQAFVYGTVFAGRGDVLRVRLTHSCSFFGTSPMKGTRALDGRWTVIGDPEIARRKAAAEATRVAETARRDAEQNAFVDTVKASFDAAVARGAVALTLDNAVVGERVYDHWTGETGTVTEIHAVLKYDKDGTCLGPTGEKWLLVDHRTVGNNPLITKAAV